MRRRLHGVEELVRCRLRWPAVAEEVACGGASGETVVAPCGGPSLFSLFSFSSSLVFFLLCFFFVRSSHSPLIFSSLFPLPSVVLSLLSLSLSWSLFCALPSVFISKTEGREVGAAPMQPPQNNR